VVVVGNKLDREAERQVSAVEAEGWARANNARYIETSSTTGMNASLPFRYASESILAMIKSGKVDPEKPGSGVSYGDRGLRNVGTPNMSASGNRLTFSEVLPNGSRSANGTVAIQQQFKNTFNGCC
jgi:hypothetical protein